MEVDLVQKWLSRIKTTFASKKITLSGVEAPDVTPSVMGPFGSQFSCSTNSPCYQKFTVKQFKDRYLNENEIRGKADKKKLGNRKPVEKMELYASVLTLSL